MKTSHIANRSAGGKRPSGAFTLVEMIGALAVLALVLVLLVPATLHHLDRLASEQEASRLQALGDALLASIQHTRSIPSDTNWAAVVASEAGLDVESVTNNSRNHPRILLVDSGGWLSTNLPYVQSDWGTPNCPTNARMILLSSLGKNLPVTTGMASAADFQALWDAPPGTVPWTGWNGNPNDVVIQRLNLAPLFVRLVLTTYNSGTNGQYVVVDNGPTNSVPRTNGFAAWFIKGTVLKLYTGAPESTFDSSQILDTDTSFVYEHGSWKASIEGTVTFGVGDVAGIVAAFLNATPNLNAQNTNGNAQQVRVVQTFTDYMSNYQAWAAGNFSDNALKTHLVEVQTNMMDAVHGLYYEGTKYDNYPTNGTVAP